LVDAGAERAVREGSASLLPVGVVEGIGDFDAADAVRITRAADGAAEGEGQGAALAKGISTYAADELRQVLGMKSAAVRELLPRASEEAVHRDYLVLEGPSFPLGPWLRQSRARQRCARRQSAPRACSAGSTPRPRTRRCTRSRTRCSIAAMRSARRTRATSRRPARRQADSG